MQLLPFPLPTRPRGSPQNWREAEPIYWDTIIANLGIEEEGGSRVIGAPREVSEDPIGESRGRRVKEGGGSIVEGGGERGGGEGEEFGDEWGGEVVVVWGFEEMGVDLFELRDGGGGEDEGLEMSGSGS